MVKTLSQIANGGTVKVTNVSQSSLKVKLMEMGIVKGRKLTVMYRAPLGDPIAIDGDGYVLSLRKDEAVFVEVESIASV